ncbi:hypothetical protein [Lysinibacillus fusiformis]|uniref:hypothetical protein n=1 Tax=Lysinibacillus fusiformis TaxID=28031 RepID=UPI003D02C15B
MITRKERIENEKITITERLDYFWMDFKDYYFKPILFGFFIGTAPFIPFYILFLLKG